MVDVNEQENESVETDAEVEAPEVDTDDEETDEPEEFDVTKAQAKIRKINAENRNLRKRATVAEEKAKGAGDSTEKAAALEGQLLRYKVALKHGLNESLAARLVGTTEEELLEDAEALLGLLGGNKPPTNRPQEKLRGGGDPTQDNSAVDINAIVKDAFDN